MTEGDWQAFKELKAQRKKEQTLWDKIVIKWLQLRFKIEDLFK